MKVIDRRSALDDVPATEQPSADAPEDKPAAKDIVPMVTLQVKCECGQGCTIWPQEVVGRFLQDGAFNITCPPCPSCGAVLRLVHPQRPEQPRIVQATGGLNRATRRRIEAEMRKGRA